MAYMYVQYVYECIGDKVWWVMSAWLKLKKNYLSLCIYLFASVPSNGVYAYVNMYLHMSEAVSAADCKYNPTSTPQSIALLVRV